MPSPPAVHIQHTIAAHRPPSDPRANWSLVLACVLASPSQSCADQPAHRVRPPAWPWHVISRLRARVHRCIYVCMHASICVLCVHVNNALPGVVWCPAPRLAGIIMPAPLDSTTPAPHAPRAPAYTSRICSSTGSQPAWPICRTWRQTPALCRRPWSARCPRPRAARRRAPRALPPWPSAVRPAWRWLA